MALSLQDVAKHNTPQSCWVIIKNKVYDVTEFLDEHPGGSNIILKYAGRDATLAYEPIHPKDALEKHLPPSKHLGSVDSASAQALKKEKDQRKKTKDEIRVEEAMKQRPPLHRILSLADMEKVARHVMSYKALVYYSSASEDMITYDENARSFSRYFFNARVMRPVGHCDPSSTILGFKSSIPVFVSGAALAKLGHPDGEANITRGAAKGNITQMVSSNASLSYEEIASAASPEQALFFQLYKHADDAIAEKRVREVERLGYKAIWLTVDAIVPSSRELDIRGPWVLEEQEMGPQYHQDGEGAADVSGIYGTAGALIVNDDRDMTWEKDAVLAAEAGVDGILISNHGGKKRDLDVGKRLTEVQVGNWNSKGVVRADSSPGLDWCHRSSMPSFEVLYRLRKQRPDVFDKVEGRRWSVNPEITDLTDHIASVHRRCVKLLGKRGSKMTEKSVEGGARRGTDVVKAVCLGAKAVGMGRPFLYAQSAYGVAGVTKIISILEREIVTSMRLLGASTLQDLKPEMVERVDWQPILHAKL
ncbi:hypothetical protein V5O48_015793 [Marasmius crinis-equi]|uniref:Uncharacterized protein n=1 Tax=Marasmius crinis-equi TaxID=585013 RepID=A0ABR3ETK6_9AGAR